MTKIIGLTGQSGAGKTTVSEIFAKNGFGVINCDLIARKATENGSECNKQLAEFFPDCFDENFMLDRKALSREVFGDPDKNKILGTIIYPYITKLIEKEILRLSGEYDYILLDAPTLFEAGADKLCSIKIAVLADPEIRLERIMQRDGISETLAKKRFSSQHSADFFKEKCDYVIYNNGEAESAAEQAEKIIGMIKES
ncbi:MAG: dephospho-CoA kinase [Ruminococcus sp.]|nr:dephospho-CoA kinase [Ruminococcus sp.]